MSNLFFNACLKDASQHPNIYQSAMHNCRVAAEDSGFGAAAFNHALVFLRLDKQIWLT